MQLLHRFLATSFCLVALSTLYGQAPTASDSKASANKELVRKIFDEVINKKNLTILDHHYANDVIDHSAFPDQAPGREGLKGAVKGMFEMFPDIKVEILEMIAEGDLIATRESWTATDKKTGKKKSGWVMHIIKFKNGIVTDEWSKGWEWME